MNRNLPNFEPRTNDYGLFSWHRCRGNSSLATHRSVHPLDHDRVYAPGSSIVTSYFNVSKSVRVNRSSSFNCSVCGSPPLVNQKSSLNPLVSTAKVSPSHFATARP